MKRHRTHQVDEAAQRILRELLPPAWLLNEQQRDYGRDYLAETAEGDELSGNSFYIQLKGTERAWQSNDGAYVRYPLETKYAKYYFDKVRDLPVFLVVVDVNQNKGWWIFLHQALAANQAWRKQKKITIRLPAANDLSQSDGLGAAIDEAKKWMRLHHPESIHDAVVAHKQRISELDPRFNASVSLLNDQPKFELHANVPVALTMEFSGEKEPIQEKLCDLFDKGLQVFFKPGEVKVIGSKLFEDVEQAGCLLQAGIKQHGSLTIRCKESSSASIGSLVEVPGVLEGGRKEVRFHGEWPNSPLAISLGPLAKECSGTLKLSWTPSRWDGQKLSRLAYFDRLNEFVAALPKAAFAEIECLQDGNCLFAASVRWQEHSFVTQLARYFEILGKARKVGKRLAVDPQWTASAFDEDAQETAEQLYAVFFEDGWNQPVPKVKFRVEFEPESFRHDLLIESQSPEIITITSEASYKLFGESVDAGRLVHTFTDVSAKICDEHGMTMNGNSPTVHRSRVKPTFVEFVGTDNSTMNVRLADADDLCASRSSA